MNRLLARQLRRFGSVGGEPPPDWAAFIHAVGTAYDEANDGRVLLERSMELASRELMERNEQLRRQIAERERVEAELRLAQKLEAVGQLASGIAHEINTPVQYVGDSVSFLKDAMADFVKFADAARSLVAASGDAALAASLQEAQEEADLDYLLDSIPGAFARASDGVQRVAKIVQAMKEFAHPDQREKSPADLNKAIENTVIVTQNEHKYVAQVEADLSPLPLVLCHVGEINQVLLNLVVNAAHAIADSGREIGDGKIRIRSEERAGSVVISVSDNGCGIPLDVQPRIFDPFFTTKEVGRGSGQGLSIARTIVTEKHGGTLTFETEENVGTTFFITLPVDERRAAA